MGIEGFAQDYCADDALIIGEFGQCIPKCGGGLEWDKTRQKCVEPVSEFKILEDHWLGIGVIIAALATGVGILFTWQDRKKERDKRTQELIQTYDEELRDITEQEKNLNTKLECSLYVERYLDSVEKIATLSLANNFQGFVTDFFENNFSYAIELWRWYQKNVVQIREEFIGEGQDLGPLWKTAIDFKRDKSKYYEELLRARIFKEFKENYMETHKDNPENKKLFASEFSDKEFKDSIFRYYDNERWREFRTWCNRTKLNSNKKKAILTPFSSNFGVIQSEKEHERQLEKSRNSGKYRILPDVLHTQYEEIPEENGLTKGELVEIIRGFAKDLGTITAMEKDLKNDETCALYAEQFLDTLEEIASLYRSDMIPLRAANYFENKFSYGINLWEWYHEKVLNYSGLLWHSLWNMDDINPTKKDEKGKINREESTKRKEQNFKEFLFQILNKSTMDKKSFYNAAISEENYDELFNKINNEIPENLKLIYQTKNLSKSELEQHIDEMDKENKKKHVREFVSKTINNERWRDFRWWCKNQKLTPFEEDKTTGLILPLRMWQVDFEKKK